MYKTLLSILTALTLAPAAAHAACATEAEAKAVNLRALKSSLMVAALSCNQQANYNSFISKNKTLFSADGEVVRGYFRRVYGSSSERELNRFVTRVANEASEISMRQDSEAYCTHMNKAFSKLSALDGKGVVKQAGKVEYASLHGIRPCAAGDAKAQLTYNQ